MEHFASFLIRSHDRTITIEHCSVKRSSLFACTYLQWITKEYVIQLLNLADPNYTSTVTPPLPCCRVPLIIYKYYLRIVFHFNENWKIINMAHVVT